MECFKSVQLKGNLLEGELIYKPFPANEFRGGLKQISISNVAFNVKEDTEHTVCTLSCNFVKFQKYNEASQVVSYQAPLQRFIINKKYDLKLLQPIWLPINSVSEELKICVSDFEEKIVVKNIDISVTVNFR